MRVGIDGMMLWGEWTGIGRSIWETARRLSSDGRGHEYLLYASRAFTRSDELRSGHFDVRRSIFSAKNRTLRIMWQQLVLPTRMIGDRIDVLHAPAYVMPVLSSIYVPVVVTVHDTIALRRPDLSGRASHAHQKRFVPKTLDRATRVLVPSRTVKSDLLDWYGELGGARDGGGERSRDELERRTRVVPLGVGPEFRPLDSVAREEAKRELGIDRPYVLFVSRAEPKKNLRSALQAFFAAAMSASLPHGMLLVGPGTSGREVRRLIDFLGLRTRVGILGYVEDKMLPRLYAAADCLIMPSIVEGFGLPLLEAMASGTPVICSDDPALKELSAGVALHVAPKRLDLLREAFERVLCDSHFAESLRRKGPERARDFTWERTVDLTVAAYEEARAEFEEAMRPQPERE